MTSNSVTEDTPADMLEGYMDLVVHLPNDTFIQYKAERRCAVMDLLVQIAAKAKLKPSEFILQPLGQNHQTNSSFKQYEYLDYTPNTPIGLLNTQVIRLIPKNDNNVTKTHTLLKSVGSNNQFDFEQDFRNKVKDFNNLTGTSAVDICNKPDFQNQFPIDPQVLSRSNYISSVLSPSLSSSCNDLTISSSGTASRQSYSQPFETTCRVQINLPKNQLHILRVKLSTTLQEMLDIVCEERSMIPDKYVFVRPDAIYKILGLQSTIKEYGLTELTLRLKSSVGIPGSEVTILREEKKTQKGFNMAFPNFFKKKDKPMKKILYGPIGKLSSEEWRSSQFPNVNRSQSTVSVRGYSQYTGSIGNLNYIIPNENENPQKFRSGSIDRFESLTSDNHKMKAPIRKKRQAPLPPPLQIQHDNIRVNNVENQDLQDIEEIQEIQEFSSGIITAHSRTSSDSSGYHEAPSVLSEGGLGVSNALYSNYGSLPSTLPRKKISVNQSASRFKEEPNIHLEIIPKIAPRKKKAAPIAPARTQFPSQNITDNNNSEIKNIQLQNVLEQNSPDKVISVPSEYTSQSTTNVTLNSPPSKSSESVSEVTPSNSENSIISRELEDEQYNDTSSVNSIVIEVYPPKTNGHNVEKTDISTTHDEKSISENLDQIISNSIQPAKISCNASSFVDEMSTAKEISAIDETKSSNDGYISHSAPCVEANKTLYYASPVDILDEKPIQTAINPDYKTTSFNNGATDPAYLELIEKENEIILQNSDVELNTSNIVVEKSTEPKHFVDENIEYSEALIKNQIKLDSRQSVSSTSDPPLLDDEDPNCNMPKYQGFQNGNTLPFIVSSDSKEDTKTVKSKSVKVSAENLSKEPILGEPATYSIVKQEYISTSTNVEKNNYAPRQEYISTSTNVEKNNFAPADEAPLEIMKKFTYRTPDIKYSTWSERPKTKVLLKSDNDYKISGQENNVKNAENPSNVIIDDQQKEETESVVFRNKKKVSSLSRSSLNVDMYRQISQVPIRKSESKALEYRKTLNYDIPREFPFGQNTLRKTGLRKIFVEEELNGNEASEHDNRTDPHGAVLPKSDENIKNEIPTFKHVEKSTVPIVKSAVLKKHANITQSENSNIHNNTVTKVIDPRASLFEQIKNQDLMKNLKKTNISYL